MSWITSVIPIFATANSVVLLLWKEATVKYILHVDDVMVEWVIFGE